MERIRGAYCEVGRVELGEPRPDMPDTLCLLVTEGEALGRRGGAGAPLTDWRLVAELEVESAGGVVEPYAKFSVEEDGVAEEEWECWPLERTFWLASTLSSVRKLALERLRKSERNEGAMTMEGEAFLCIYFTWA